MAHPHPIDRFPQIPIMHNPSEKPKLDIPRDWQLTRRVKCPTCGKRYAVVEWQRYPICRQCGDALRPEDPEGKSTLEAGAETG